LKISQINLTRHHIPILERDIARREHITSLHKRVDAIHMLWDDVVRDAHIKKVMADDYMPLEQVKVIESVVRTYEEKVAGKVPVAS